MRNQIQTAPLALQAVLRMAAMVPDHEDAHAIARDSIEEVIGKAIAVGSPNSTSLSFFLLKTGRASYFIVGT